MKREVDIFNKHWITENSIDIISRYDPGILTLRALHYQLVSIGMTNDMQHYKRVVSAMIDARWDGSVEFDTFSDLDRGMVSETKANVVDIDEQISVGKDQVKAWMDTYRRNRWENQIVYPEVLIEKKALQGVFQSTCEEWDIALGACKGYPSLTFLYEISKRMINAVENYKNPMILYFGDYDPSGEDIPRSIKENLSRFGVDVEVRVIALNEIQVLDWNLPPAPVKVKDTRSSQWNGIGQVELDAVQPTKLISLLTGAIEDVFDQQAYDELMDIQEKEVIEYKKELRKFINDMRG